VVLAVAATAVSADPIHELGTFDFEALQLAVDDLSAEFGQDYPNGQSWSGQCRRLAAQSADTLAREPNNTALLDVLLQRARDLHGKALLANPLLNFNELILLKRKRGQLGLPDNHKCNSGISRTGYDNEIAVLSPVGPSGRVRTLYAPSDRRFVGEIDLHWNAERLLFTMPDSKSWRIHEIGADGDVLRQVSPDDHPDVDHFDACYLPNGRIAFASTASYHAVPCWHGVERACSIYAIDADGTAIRQLCFDQDLDLHPSVLPDGRITFSRWDYSGTMHIYLRPLMAMNPDGTGQRALYGSNSYWPNALYFPRGIPGSPNRIIAIVAGYHGVPRMGELALLDIARGERGADGVIQLIPGRNRPVETPIRDNLVDDSWPKFLHPWPLSDKYFLVSAQLSAKAPWGIYLVDVFDNMTPIHVSQTHEFFEPIPLCKQPIPPAIPERVDYTRNDATVYLHDIYAGPGLAGVPRGMIKRLRLVAYHFGYPGLAGPDKIGCGGPWEAMRILGTVPVDADGSAVFSVPAATPITVQPLDADGKAVQLMRSWLAAMPGEYLSCVGCHEKSSEIPTPAARTAAKRKPDPIEPWYGPARGFDFQREVQPVLDRHCVSCHNGELTGDGRSLIDLRDERFHPDYRGRELTRLGSTRLHPAVRDYLGGTAVRYTPAYEALLPYIRRVNIEDEVEMLAPGEYHADTSELIQCLAKGHHGVRLDRESWDRLITWIDLNGPCHGTWSDIAPVPEGAAQRRRQLAQLYGGPAEDPERIPDIVHPSLTPVAAMTTLETPPIHRAPPVVAPIASRPTLQTKTVPLGRGLTMRLVRIPAGRFLMGSSDGLPDEQPPFPVTIDRDFWMGVCEVTNAQYALFDPTHNSGRFTKRFEGPDGPGLSLNGPDQPVVRVSWLRAMDFCHWLSDRTGETFSLPTEAQWEYACRAGTTCPLSFGGVDTDFSAFANCADRSLSVKPGPTGGLESSINLHFGKGILESTVGGLVVCDVRFDDGAVATAPVAHYHPNPWGLHDMHGNAAEWTATTYEPYTCNGAASDDPGSPITRKVVRGGSWCDRPARCRSAFRLAYPAWQPVHNTGFRVTCEVEPAAVATAGGVSR